jgi:ABC-2 type transport system permease protein
MAGIGAPGDTGSVMRGGPFGGLARSQYRALAAMRWSLFRNSLRTNQGAFEFGARSIAFITYSIMGLGLATGLGVGAYAMVAHDKWQFVPLLVWLVFVLWQIVPVSLASFQQQFDMGGLLRFPVGFGAFYFLHVIFGLVEASTILGGFCCLGIWIGITVARPDLSGWAALALAVFAAFNVLLVRAIFAWIDRWLAQRRTREIVSAVFFLFLMSLQVLNPSFGLVKYQSPRSREAQAVRQRRQMEFGPWVQTADAVQSWLPPGLAAGTLQHAAKGDPGPATGSLGVLALFVLAAGGVLGIRLRAEYRGENLGEAPSRKKAERHSGKWILDGSGPIAAVMEKELRTLMRALPLLYGLGAPLLMVFILSGLFRRGGSVGGHPLPMALLISLGYVMVGFTQLFYNNLGAEGPGIQILFLSPTPIRTVILAKNLFHASLLAVDAVLVAIVASLRYGTPTPMALVATVAWLLFALPVHLAAGNAFSLAMPYRMNLGRIGRQRGSQSNALLSMLIQLGVLGVGAGIFALCAFFDKLWVAVPIFLAMAAASIFAWVRVLGNIDSMANRHREALVAALVKTE